MSDVVERLQQRGGALLLEAAAEIARLRAEVAALREQMAAAAKCSEIVREAMSFLLLPSEKAALRQCCPGFPASPEGRCTCDEAGAGWEARG